MDAKRQIEKSLEFNIEKTEEKIKKFIKNKIEEAEADGAVIGLSGGLDSSIASFITAEAIGGENILTISMPEAEITEKENRKDAKKISKMINSKFKEIEINPFMEVMESELDYEKEATIANANLKPRIRMIILYYYANKLNYLVVGGSNKSEIKTGYFTKFGDGAADLLPLGDLYKTQERKLAEKMGVPKQIVEKTPTAGLWKNQKDKDELGIPYDKIDRIYAGLDLDLDVEELANALNVKESKILEFINRKKKSMHKRKRPPTPGL